MRRLGRFRLPADVADQSSPAARSRFNRRLFCFRAATAVIYLVGIAMVTVILDSVEDPSSLSEAESAALALTVFTVPIIGIFIAIYVFQFLSPTLNTVLAVNDLATRWKQLDDEGVSWPDDATVRYRQELRRAVRLLARIAARLDRRESGHPAALLYRAVIFEVTRYLRSPASLTASADNRSRELLLLVSSSLVGGCNSAVYDTLAAKTGATGDDGEPAEHLRRQPGRLGRITRSVIEKAEPADKLVSTLTKVVFVVLVLLLAALGQLTLSEVAERFK